MVVVIVVACMLDTEGVREDSMGTGVTEVMCCDVCDVGN